jgi:hypothetical protein
MKGGVHALRRRRAAGFDTDLWTLDRVVQVIQATTGVRLSRLGVAAAGRPAGLELAAARV